MAEGPRIVRSDPIPANILDILRTEGRAGGVSTYPDRLARQFRRSQIAAALTQLGRIIEPSDKVLGIDTDLPRARAFRAGGLIGLRVAAVCVDDVDRALLDVAMVPEYKPDKDDKTAQRHAWSEAIIDLGNQGFAHVEDTFAPLFDEWEDALVPDVRAQRVLRSGFGLPISYLATRDRLNQEAAYAAELAAMAAEADAFNFETADWSQLLED